jgi:hypothetical protein
MYILLIVNNIIVTAHTGVYNALRGNTFEGAGNEYIEFG